MIDSVIQIFLKPDMKTYFSSLSPVSSSTPPILFLADIIRLNRRLPLREGNSNLFSCFDTFDEPGHIVAEGTHGLETFLVLSDLIGGVAVYHVPVAGADDRHLGIHRVLVQGVQRGGGSGAGVRR